jgi:hypothetical protein
VGYHGHLRAMAFGTFGAFGVIIRLKVVGLSFGF